ncbi:hypothetical protein A8B79_02450 [Balneola sp. EhC07]|uniref:hypothetical protein n=1 Tax=Balneola sp. EhC07 TaxID=1849360 RepID=UPI0007F33DB7|nr:hypothetical protein [Balneola sp. EhC07]OAN62431.1 hypothetical protein A8B79_02450 [Balneola sp. EhC07]
MDTKRRMIEIKVWDYRYFNELDASEKLFYWFINCHCDNAGVYEHSPKLSEFHCNSVIDINNFLDKINCDKERIRSLNNNSIWIKDFIKVTWTTIAGNNNLGLSCYKLLVYHNLLEEFIETYPNHINIPSFYKAIKEEKKGYSGLPLPQTRPRSGGINNNISNNTNNTDNNSISSAMEKVLKGIPKHIAKYPEHVLIAELEKIRKKNRIQIDQFVTVGCELVLNIDWETHDWNKFIKILDENFNNQP